MEQTGVAGVNPGRIGLELQGAKVIVGGLGMERPALQCLRNVMEWHRHSRAERHGFVVAVELEGNGVLSLCQRHQVFERLTTNSLPLQRSSFSRSVLAGGEPVVDAMASRLRR